jgi:hypothetical protein
MAAEGKISPEDLDLLFITDSPAEAVAHVVRAYKDQLEDAHARPPPDKRRAVGDPRLRGGNGGRLRAPPRPTRAHALWNEREP